MAGVALPDPNIILSAQYQQQPDPMKTYTNVMAAKSMQLDYNAKVQDANDTATMTRVLKDIDPRDPNYDDKATKALMEAGVAPQRVAQFRADQLGVQAKQAEIDLKTAQTHSAQAAYIKNLDEDQIQQLDYATQKVGDSLIDVKDTYDSIVAKGGPNAASTAAATADQVRKIHFQQIIDDPSMPEKTKAAAKAEMAKPFDINEVTNHLANNDRYKQLIQNRKTEQQTAESKAREERDLALAERSLNPPKVETEVRSIVGADGKTHDIMFNKQTGDQIRDLGESKGAGGAGGGGRAQIYNNRIVNAANEASESLSNLSKLSINSSTGFLSPSKHAGMLDASYDMLANAITPQDQQTYKVVAAGLSRSLGTLETSGLSVPEGVRKQLDEAMELAPGDTNLTKTQKLAEGRQVFDKAVEAAIATPGINEDQKKLLTDTLEKVHKAIPFTQAQIIDYQNKVVNKGQKMTIGEWLDKEGKEGEGKKDSDMMIDNDTLMKYAEKHNKSIPEAKEFLQSQGYKFE